MLQVEALTKKFGTLTAVDSLTLSVAEGEAFGFLGPNGAGKTTTVRMLTSLISPTSGHATVNGLELGKDNDAIRANVGILTETPGMYDRLSAEKNLTIFAKLYGVKDVPGQVQKYLRMLGLWERRQDEAGSFSKGMRQKLAIARALLHEPKIVFLDEPTSGLDPEAAKLVRDFVAELKTEGRTIFLTTHNLDEADRLCNRVGIFKTHLIKLDTPANLRQSLYGRQVVFHVEHLEPAWVEEIRALPFVKKAETLENKLIVGLDEPELQNPIIIRQLVAAGANLQFVGEVRHSLEDVYLQLIHQTSDTLGKTA
jgi:ABC-2 type transport system ATP-binding protein